MKPETEALWRSRYIVMHRADFSRIVELEGYAIAHRIELAEAIDRLICSGLSHEPELYL